MLVLKFGGTSVASAKNIALVKNILASKKQPLVAVVSAFGGITNLLVQCSELAASGDDSYEKHLSQIESIHIKTVKELISVKGQSKSLSKVKILLNELEDIYRGVYLIRELSLKTQDRILGFGETLSSIIINDYLNDAGFKSNWADAKQFITTDSNYGTINGIVTT